MNREGRDRGFILPVAIVVLAVLVVLLSAAFYLTLLDHRAEMAAIDVVTAMADAERRSVRGWRTWSPRQLADLAIGDSASGGGGFLTVVRMRADLFVFRGVGQAGYAVRRVSRLARLEPVPIGLEHALTTPGPVRTQPGVTILESPTGRSRVCDRADSTAAGWVAPATFVGPTENHSRWASLATTTLPAGSVVRPAPRFSSRACVVTDPLNWGDPGATSACGEYFPVVHVAGDLTMTGGLGQGVLVVDGDLEMSGGARFDGLILIRGRFNSTGAAGVVTGAIQALEPTRGSDLVWRTEITYSTCKLEQATRPNGKITMVGPGGWLGEY